MEGGCPDRQIKPNKGAYTLTGPYIRGRASGWCLPQGTLFMNNTPMGLRGSHLHDVWINVVSHIVPFPNLRNLVMLLRGIHKVPVLCRGRYSTVRGPQERPHWVPHPSHNRAHVPINRIQATHMELVSLEGTSTHERFTSGAGGCVACLAWWPHCVPLLQYLLWRSKL